MTIQLLARHFAGANFMSAGDCPLARAIKEMHPLAHPIVGFAIAHIGHRHFNLETPYHEPDFTFDLELAEKYKFGIRIIREINLNEIHE